MTITKESSEKLQNMMQKAVAFHGHSCPGLAIGVVASKIALESAKRAEDEELVAIVENDACGVDGIQALTGCTFGKGNLIHKDHGKSVYTFYNRNIGEGLRLSLKSEVFSEDDELNEHRKALFEKVRLGKASTEEQKEHNRLREEKTNSILEKGSAIFQVEQVKMIAPEKARIFDTIFCDNCGESVMTSRTVEYSGKKICIPCSKKSN